MTIAKRFWVNWSEKLKRKRNSYGRLKYSNLDFDTQIGIIFI